MTPEEAYEQALQKYVVACIEYKQATTCLIRDVGMNAAMPKLEDAMNRICNADVVYMSEEEVQLRASKAKQIIDDDGHWRPAKSTVKGKFMLPSGETLDIFDVKME